MTHLLCIGNLYSRLSLGRVPITSNLNSPVEPGLSTILPISELAPISDMRRSAAHVNIPLCRMPNWDYRTGEIALGSLGQRAE